MSDVGIVGLITVVELVAVCVASVLAMRGNAETRRRRAEDKKLDIVREEMRARGGGYAR